MRFLIYWTFTITIFSSMFSDNFYTTLPFYSHSDSINLFMLIACVLFVFQTHEVFIRSLYFHTIRWWDALERDINWLYLKKIKKSHFIYLTDKQWFNEQLTSKYSKGFKFFSGFILLFIICAYISFFIVAIICINIHQIMFEMFFAYFLENISSFFFCLYVFSFFSLIFRSYYKIPDSWFFMIFSIHQLSKYYDWLGKEHAWYNLLMELFLDYQWWDWCPMFRHNRWYFYEKTGISFLDTQRFFFYRNLEEWIVRFPITREWINCKTFIFDSYTKNYVFEFFFWTKLILGTISTRGNTTKWGYIFTAIYTPHQAWRYGSEVRREKYRLRKKYNKKTKW